LVASAVGGAPGLHSVVVGGDRDSVEVAGAGVGATGGVARRQGRGGGRVGGSRLPVGVGVGLEEAGGGGRRAAGEQAGEQAGEAEGGDLDQTAGEQAASRGGREGHARRSGCNCAGGAKLPRQEPMLGRAYGAAREGTMTRLGDG